MDESNRRFQHLGNNLACIISGAVFLICPLVYRDAIKAGTIAALEYFDCYYHLSGDIYISGYIGYKTQGNNGLEDGDIDLSEILGNIKLTGVIRYN